MRTRALPFFMFYHLIDWYILFVLGVPPLGSGLSLLLLAATFQDVGCGVIASVPNANLPLPNIHQPHYPCCFAKEVIKLQNASTLAIGSALYMLTRIPPTVR